LNNPIDLLPGATSDIYREVNEIILQDENVDALISIFVEPVMVDAFEVIESVNSIKSEKPIYQVCMPLPDFWIKYAEKSNFNTPVFRTPEDPAEIIANLLHYELHKNDRLNFKNSISSKNIDYQNAGFLEQQNVMEVCKKYNIPVIESSIVSIEQIDNYDNFDFPIVVKGLSKTLIHKSELDAVKLNIGEKSKFLHAVKEIKDSFHNHNYELEELMIQRFVDGKHELLVGGYRDHSFGPVIMFGSGGKYVEILEDNQIRSAYMGTTDLESIISNTKIGKILKGVRGERGIDINKLKMLLSSVARMMLENENILEIDLNPLVVDKNLNFFAVDVRIKSI
jgi:acetyltransferase